MRRKPYIISTERIICTACQKVPPGLPSILRRTGTMTSRTARPTADHDALGERAPLGQKSHAHAERKENTADGAEYEGDKVYPGHFSFR